MTEEQQLIELAQKSFRQRIAAYVRLSGPGYMQSAMTLGGGSIAACAMMGSLLGYELLWVQAAAIILGFILLSAVAKQTLHSGEGAYQVFWHRLHPALALVWGGSALVATVLWHIPQYSLTANGVVSLAEGAGLDFDTTVWRIGIGIVVLGLATWTVYLYNTGAGGLRLYERAVKVLVWTIVVAFAIVAFATGIEWKRLLLGMTGISFVQDLLSGDGIDPRAVKPIVGGIAAAVGINMVFLYPYSLLNKNWGKNHKELAYFDLFSGMVIPFFIATTFMIIAVANTVGPAEGQTAAEAVKDVRTIVPVLGPTFAGFVGSEAVGRGLALLLVALGMIAIGFSTIITHMLASGFICCELFGFEYRGKAKFWFSLVPAVGMVGVFLPFPFYAAVTASSLAAVFMPVAIIGFIILMNMRSYMTKEMPHGAARGLWNLALVVYLIVVAVASYFGLRTNWTDLQVELKRRAEAAVVEEPAAPAEDDREDARAPSFSPLEGGRWDVAREDARAPDYARGYARAPDYARGYARAPDDARGYARAPAAAGPRKPVLVQRELMYSTFQFIIYPRPEDEDTLWAERAAESAFEAVESLERRISVWKDDSQATRINEMAATRPVQASQDVIDVIVLSQDLHARTHGAFDISVGPLIDLWGYYRKENHMPSQEEVNAAMALVGLDKVTVDRQGRSVLFSKAGVRLDFGGIAKGLAIDEAAAVFRKYKIPSALLNGGSSSILAIGAPPGEEGWTVQVTLPDSETEVITEVVLLDEAISTSGCYGKYQEFDGAKYCHIFDPRTGWPAPGVTSATAFCKTAAEADGLSTAFVVLGKEGTETFCRENPGVRAIIVPATDDGRIVLHRFNFPPDNALSADDADAAVANQPPVNTRSSA